MKIDRIIANQFLIYQHVDVPLEDGIYGIQGRNGGGKSSFVDMVLYPWFGYTRTKSDKELIRNGADDDMYVEIHNSFEKDKIILKRGRKLNGDYILTFNVNGEDKTCDDKDDTERIIRKYLNVKLSSFCSTVVFKQEDSDEFLKSTPGKAEEFIIDILNLGFSDKLIANAKSKHVDENKKIIEIDGSIKTLAQQKNEYNIEKFNKIDEVIKQKERNKEEQTQIQGKIKLIEERITEEKGKIAESKKSVEKIEKLNTNLVNKVDQIGKKKESLEKSHKSLELKLKEFEKSNEKLSNSKDVIFDKEKLQQMISDSVKLQKDIDELQGETKSYKTNIEWLNKNGKCPTCKQKIADRDNIVKEAQDKIDKIMSRVNKISDNLSVKNVEIAKETKSKIVKEEYDKIVKEVKEVNEKLKEVNENISTFKTEITTLNDEHNNLIKEITKERENVIDDFESKQNVIKVDEKILSNTKEELKTNNEKNDIFVEEIAKIKSNKKTYESIGEKLEIKNVELNKLKKNSKTFGSLVEIFTKMKKLRLKESIEIANIEANNILDKLDPADRQIIFSFKDDKKNSFETWITTNNYKRKYASYSGAQKLFINLCVHLGFAEMMTTLYGSKPDFVFLDEIFAPADDENREHVMSVINNLYNVYSQVFVITHTNIKELFPKNIFVEPNDDFTDSSIRVE